MKIIKKTPSLVILIFVAGMFALMGCEKKVELEKFTSKAGRFTIMAPGKPEKNVQTLDTEAGTVRLIMFMVNKPKISYMASYVDYPEGAVSNSDPDEVLKGARNGMLSNIQGKLISEERIAYDNDPAVEIHYTAKGKEGIGHTVLLLSGNRLYQVGAIGHKNNFPADAVKQYIDSFEVW